MKHIRKIFIPLIFCLAGLMEGCAKDGGACFTNTGNIIRQTRHLADYSQVDLGDNVCLILASDSSAAGSAEVEAGENVIRGISTEVTGGCLFIRNHNKCNWLRDYSKPINVYLSSDHIWEIRYNGSGDIRTTGTLKQDSLAVIVWGGCGTINLRLDIWQGRFSLNMGTVDFRLHGKSSITSVFTADYGLYDARDMKTGYTFITSRGSNDCYVRASNGLDATITSIGNIYYSGDPENIKVNITGTGKLIKN